MVAGMLVPYVLHRHRMTGMRGVIHRCRLIMLVLLRPSRRTNRRRGQQRGGKHNPVTHIQIPSTLYNVTSASIQSAIATIIRFSVSETKPSGTLEFPPTQAHLSSRLSI